MKKVGFTLIELLAVIVVLALVALIATPLVMNTIKSTEKETTERSMENYLRAVEIMVMEERSKKNKLKNGEYEVDPDGNLVRNSITYLVKTQGQKPAAGSKIVIENGLVVAALSSDPTIKTLITTNDGKYRVEFGNDNKLIAIELGNVELEPTYKKLYSNGDIVYFRVTGENAGKSCTELEYAANVDNEGNTGCMKFYAFNDTEESDRVNLLLDHNTTANIAWNSSYVNTNGPNELKTQLATDTTGWVAEKPNPYVDPAKKYKITYETNARLITANEIASITGNTSFDSAAAVDLFYFDTNTTAVNNKCQSGKISECRYGWLYDKTSLDCKNYGCLNNSNIKTYGYWTASAYFNHQSYAWHVYFDAGLKNNRVNFSGIYGIRPVIEVLKSNL